jgi:hypothetical protein
VDTLQKHFEYFQIHCKVSSCVNDIIQWIICLHFVGRFTIDKFSMSITDLKIEHSRCSMPNSFFGLSACLTQNTAFFNYKNLLCQELLKICTSLKFFKFKKYECYDDFVRNPNTKIHEISSSRLCSDADGSVTMGKLFSLSVCEQTYLLIVNINESHVSRYVKYYKNEFAILWFD